MNLRQQSRLRAQRRSALAMKARQRRMRAEVSAAALDRAKAKTGSDYKTAQIIHTTPQRVSDYRKARRPMGPEQAARLAYFLGDPILQAVALALAFSCKKRQTRGHLVEEGKSGGLGFLQNQ